MDLRRPEARQRLYRWARIFVRDHLQPGDRVMLVVFTGWPSIRTGWLEDRDQIIAAIDALEVDPAVVSTPNIHVNDNNWWDGLRSLVTALGRYEGSKLILRMANKDPAQGFSPWQLAELNGRLAAERSTIYAVNAFFDCPLVLLNQFSTLALNAGGTSLGKPHHAAAKLDKLLRCRYLLSFKPDDTRQRQLRVRSLSKDFKISTLIGYESLEDKPSHQQEREALFLLPSWSDGFRLEAGLWPLRPTSKRKRWRALALARLELTESYEDLDEIDSLTLDVIVHARSRIAGEFQRTISREELKKMRQRGEPKSFAFPLEVKAGEYDLITLASSEQSDLSATLRTTVMIPEPPGPGEAGPWMLVDRLAEVSGRRVPMPALDGVIAEGTRPVFLGYGCRDVLAERFSGSIAPLTEPTAEEFTSRTTRTIDVALSPLSPSRNRHGCGWLIASPDRVLPPGMWVFTPNAVGKAEHGTQVFFRVLNETEDSARNHQ